MVLLIFLLRARLQALEFYTQSAFFLSSAFGNFSVSSRQTEWIKVPRYSALFLLLWVNIIWIANVSASVSDNLTNELFAHLSRSLSVAFGEGDISLLNFCYVVILFMWKYNVAVFLHFMYNFVIYIFLLQLYWCFNPILPGLFLSSWAWVPAPLPPPPPLAPLHTCPAALHTR